jgi:hypothetical protein
MAEHVIFVVSGPGQMQDRSQKKAIRSHAIRGSLKRRRDLAIKRLDNFVAMGIGHEDLRTVNRWQSKDSAVERPLSIALLDPFNCLPNSPERLKLLMRHSKQPRGKLQELCLRHI